MSRRSAPDTLASVPGCLNFLRRRFAVTATAGAMVLAGGACGSSNGSHTVTPTPALAACRAAVTAAASPSNTSPGTVRAVRILEACPDRGTIDAELRRVAGPEDVTQEDQQLPLACRAVHPVPASCAGFTSH